MAKLVISKEEKERQAKQLMDADLANIRASAQGLAEKRDELLQEVLELQNEISTLEARKRELMAKAKHRMTEVVLCEKMIVNFGNLDSKGSPENG